MKRICAWCKTEMAKVETLDVTIKDTPELVTHGICEPCRDVMMKDCQKANETGLK